MAIITGNAGGGMLTITLISDTHGKHSQIDVGQGDLIIHSGDATSKGRESEVQAFLKWYGNLDFETKIFVPGNHELLWEANPKYHADMCSLYGVTLLNDSGTTYRGIKIWGSPVQPEFHGWAFNRARTEADVAITGHPFIGPHWQAIPDDTDLLVTHGPAHGILDPTRLGPAGCKLLLARIKEVRPVLHVSGHIHGGRGIHDDGDTIFVNASSLDEQYQPYPDPVFKLEWESLRRGITD